MKIIICFFVSISILFYNCTGKKQSELEFALQLAGDNRVELEKILARYSLEPADSLKYKAACFLIENMPGYHYYEGDALEKYANYFKILGEDKKTPKEILDSLQKIYGAFDLSALTLKFDIKEIDSAYLCNNIDFAFKVWTEKPWGKNVTFNDFCEYILPYRIDNEKLTNWRKDYLEEYGNLIEHVTTQDPVEAATILRREIFARMRPNRFTMARPNGYPSLDAFTAKNLTGTCDNVNQFILFLFRANGIPCAIDYTPVKGRNNSAHLWVSLKNNQNEYFAIDYFGVPTYVSGTEHNRKAIKPKAYRKTFSINTADFNILDKKSTSIPKAFSKYSYRFHDVTDLYSNHLMDLSIPKTMVYGDRTKRSRIFYLCVPSKMNWVPVDWTDRYKKGTITFKNIEAGCTYRVATFEDNNLVYITDPFTANIQTKKINVLGNHGKIEKAPLIVYSKFSLADEEPFRNRMIRGVFEASNNAGFKESDTLHVIRDKPYRLLHHVPVSSEKSYRYVRYKGGENSYCNVAEVQFYSDSIYLQGKIIGTPRLSQTDGTHEYTNVFDGSTETSFDHDTPDDGWAGLDLGVPRKITEIIYSPRNYDNYIKKGDLYELFISDRNGWSSQGMQTASSDSLRYEDIPRGYFYYLKNHSGGLQERPFMMVDGKAVFM